MIQVKNSKLHSLLSTLNKGFLSDFRALNIPVCLAGKAALIVHGLKEEPADIDLYINYKDHIEIISTYFRTIFTDGGIRSNDVVNTDTDKWRGTSFHGEVDGVKYSLSYVDSIDGYAIPISCNDICVMNDDGADAMNFKVIDYDIMVYIMQLKAREKDVRNLLKLNGDRLTMKEST